MIISCSKLKDDLKFTNINFVNKIGINKDFFSEKLNIPRKNIWGQFTEHEKNFLFNFARHIKPKKILEFSPSYGYSTLIVCAAVNQFNFYETYEINEKCHKITKENLKTNNFEKVNVVLGDVLETMDLEKLKECDFLIVDSDHSREFSEKYVNKFFPLLKKGTWVHVHDVVSKPINEETEVVKNYLDTNKITNMFHLPELLKFYDIEDNGINVLNNFHNIEHSTSLYFKI